MTLTHLEIVQVAFFDEIDGARPFIQKWKVIPIQEVGQLYLLLWNSKKLVGSAIALRGIHVVGRLFESG